MSDTDSTSPVDHVRVYIDDAGEARWTAVAGNGEPVADSGEGYVDLDHAYEMAASMFPTARILIEGGRLP